MKKLSVLLFCILVFCLNCQAATQEEVKQAIKETILFEAEFLIRNHTEEDGRKKNKWKTLQEAKNSLIEYKNDILDKIEKRGPGDYSNTSVDKAKLPRVEYVIDLINRIDSINTDAVIIHGVHRFTPEILLMIILLRNADEIIFCRMNKIYTILCYK